MNDLDKMMEKLNKDSPVEKEDPKKDLIDKDDDNGEDLEDEAKESKPLPEETTDAVNDTVVSDIPKDNKEEIQQDMAENEVGILQNVGVFRRELLIVKKDFLEVEKIKVQALITIAKSLEGLNGKK